MDNMREKTDRSIRLLKMFDMLQRGAGLNSRELQDRFGITAKSVQRDIEELRTYIADNYDQAEGENIEYSRIQKSYFWRNRSNIMLDEKEILLIAVILLESRGLTKDELQRLLEKILLQCSKTSEKKIRQLIQNEMFYYKATQNAKPKLNNLWKHLINTERIKSIQPLFRCIRNIRICMLRHNIGNVFKHLQREQIQIAHLFAVAVNRLLQRSQIFVDIPLELHPVYSRNRSTGSKRHLLSVNFDILNHAHKIIPLFPH